MRLVISVLSALLLFSCSSSDFAGKNIFQKTAENKTGANAQAASTSGDAETDGSNQANGRASVTPKVEPASAVSQESRSQVCTRVNKRWIGPEKINLNENTPGTAPDSQKSHATCRENAPAGFIFDSVNCLQSPWSCTITNAKGGCGEPNRPCFTCQCNECSGDVLHCN